MVEKRMAKLAVLGHGVVGSGVVELFERNRDSIETRAGQKMDVKYILDIRDFTDLPYSEKFTKNFDDILNDEEVVAVAEVMGGLEPAYTYTKALLEHGKSVVTSNKELVAVKGGELLCIAKEHNVNFFFEASVGGGIPIIQPMHQCLAANRIREVVGILNGTTNFILTRMIREQMGFDEALKMAQELGYAERNPAADVEGTDTCRKICILASLAFGRQVDPKTVYTEGITKLTLADAAYAEHSDRAVKLIGRAKQLEDGNLTTMVFPVFLPKSSQLSGIDDVFNGILVRGDATGDVMFYGKGAGKFPTASAVAADLIEAVKASGTSCSLTWEETPKAPIKDWRVVPFSFYLRIRTTDPQAVLSKLRNQMPELKILSRSGQPEDEVAVETSPMSERRLEEIWSGLSGSENQLLGKIRILDD